MQNTDNQTASARQKEAPSITENGIEYLVCDMKNHTIPAEKPTAHKRHSFDDLTKDDWYAVQGKLIAAQAHADALAEALRTIAAIQRNDSKVGLTVQTKSYDIAREALAAYESEVR